MDECLSIFEYSQRFRKAQRWARRIIQFPFVRKVSLTGSMATRQATPESDIDLFIQVGPGNLWWVRLAITIWIHFAGERRTQYAIANKLCLNWFATFDGPRLQSRPHIVLAEYSDRGNNFQPQFQKIKNQKFPRSGISPRETKVKIKSKIQNDREFFLKPFCPLLEFMSKNVQQHRFDKDRRTFLPGSQVRYSNTELGFHPPKNILYS